MNDQRTTSILQRLPMILAVTAASYGLPMQAQAHRATTGLRHAVSAAMPSALDRAEATLPTQH
jgi:hypothetical protein